MLRTSAKRRRAKARSPQRQTLLNPPAAALVIDTFDKTFPSGHLAYGESLRSAESQCVGNAELRSAPPTCLFFESLIFESMLYRILISLATFGLCQRAYRGCAEIVDQYFQFYLKAP